MFFAASFTGQNYLQLIFYLAVLVGILFITYYFTKWFAGYQKNQGFNRNFEVIETMKVSPNKFLMIVRVGKDEYHVIAIGKDEICSLGKIDKSQLILSDGAPEKGNFKDIFASFKTKSSDLEDNDDKGESDDED